MRRWSLVLAALLAAALLAAGCGGSGGQTASAGSASVTVPSGVDTLKGELAAILDQFPYQHWYNSCVEKRISRALGPRQEKALSDASDSEREAKLNELPNFEATVAVDGFEPFQLHFVHQKSPAPDAIPLLFVHGCAFPPSPPAVLAEVR